MQFQGEIIVNRKVCVEKHLALCSVVRYLPGVDVDNFSKKQQRKEKKSNKQRRKLKLCF